MNEPLSPSINGRQPPKLSHPLRLGRREPGNSPARPDLPFAANHATPVATSASPLGSANNPQLCATVRGCRRCRKRRRALCSGKRRNPTMCWRVMEYAHPMGEPFGLPDCYVISAVHDFSGTVHLIVLEPVGAKPMLTETHERGRNRR